MIPELVYTYWPRVQELIDDGYALSEICDRYGRPIHPDAVPFFQHHRQARRQMCKQYILQLQ